MKPRVFPTTVIPGLIFFLSLPISFFLALLEQLPHLTPNLTVSSCVSFGSVSTPAFSVICSWTPSRSQMCCLLMLQHLGLYTALSLQRGKPTENPTGSQLVGCTILTSQGGIAKEYKAGPKGRGLRAKGTQVEQKLTASGAEALDEPREHWKGRAWFLPKQGDAAAQSEHLSLLPVNRKRGHLVNGWDCEHQRGEPRIRGRELLRRDTGPGPNVLVLGPTSGWFSS